jgi:twitching motility protein PilT
MPKIDAYLRSIERFGATGALLSSGQSITLRFPTGDRHATQVTPHELLVAMIREVAPPQAWASLDSGRPARFEIESGGNRFAIAATPQPGAWQVAIELAHAGGGAEVAVEGASAPASAGAGRPARGREAERVGERGVDELSASLAIERTQYDEPGGASAGSSAGSGSLLLDQLLAWARGHKASDLVLAAGAPPQARRDGRWLAAEDQLPIDGDVLARELGVLAPAAARSAWFERGEACFAAEESAGRLRVQLGRDSNGPRASIRFVLPEPPSLDRLGVPEAARRWLRARRGLIAVAGGPGSGRSTTLASLVRELAQGQAASIVSIEDPIELRHRGAPLVSQREVGPHVASAAAGVRAAMREGADAIAVARCDGAETLAAIAEAVAAGHLVLVTLDAASSQAALARLAASHHEGSSGAVSLIEPLLEHVLGVITQQLCDRADGAGRLAAFEVVPGGPELGQLVRERRWDLLPELFTAQRAAGALSQRDAIAELVRRGYVTAPAA